MRADKVVAVLAVLVGALEVMNALGEGRANLTAHPGGTWPLTVTAGAVAGALLVVAGAVLPRRTAGATWVARGAALACVATFIGIQLLAPWMSLVSNLLGIALPVAVLLVAGRRRGASVPAVA